MALPAEQFRHLPGGGFETLPLDHGPAPSWEARADAAGWVPPAFWEGAHQSADTLEGVLGYHTPAGSTAAFLPNRITRAAEVADSTLARLALTLTLHRALLVFGLPAAFALGVAAGVWLERRRAARALQYPGGARWT